MLCMLNKNFSDSFHLHLKFLLEDLGESLLSDSNSALNRDCELCQFCSAVLFGAALGAALEREQLWPPWRLCREHVLALSSTLGVCVS